MKYDEKLIYDGFDKNDSEVKETESTNRDTSDFIKNIDMNKKNSMPLPPPPKPGEIMLCMNCKRKMTLDAFSDDELLSKVEFKWHLCKDCYQQARRSLDMHTPGIYSERYKKKREEKPKEVFKPKSYLQLKNERRANKKR